MLERINMSDSKPIDLHQADINAFPSTTKPLKEKKIKINSTPPQFDEQDVNGKWKYS